MDFGDRVIHYTHRANDEQHTTEDELAIVLYAHEDGSADLVVFPVGGPVKFLRAWPFKEKENEEEPIVGYSYIRPWGSEAPDFQGFADKVKKKREQERDRAQKEAEAKKTEADKAQKAAEEKAPKPAEPEPIPEPVQQPPSGGPDEPTAQHTPLTGERRK